MPAPPTSPTPKDAEPEVLGYLNLASGTSDPQFLGNLATLARAARLDPVAGHDFWSTVCTRLLARLDALERTSPAFADVEQARSVLRLALHEFRPQYLAFHRDLLFHQREADLWTPLFLGRVFEALLAQGSPWNEGDRIVAGAIERLNDYVGHRPVAVLNNAQRMEPYPHEWIRPVPLYVKGAGVSAERYQALVERALEILRATDPAILSEAMFDPQLLDELAFDPRAYDFDQPTNKRPNYHFGQWDPHHIDNQGRYRRFVVQQVTLDVLLSRVENPGEIDADELLLEAAAVLAGTILMASGTSGNGPDAHDSALTLAKLLPRIAAYRDAFYENFVAQQSGPHGQRLREEANAGKQPLAGARQNLNQQLARRRAAQLEHVHLAVLYARMGYADAALTEAQIVPVASARILAEVECRLTTAHLAIDRGQLETAVAMIEEIEQYIARGIECGALVDPWNILGFGGQFSLFPSPENSVHDHRVDQLIAVMGQLFGLYSRVWSEAAAQGEARFEPALERQMRERARWWDRFAPTTVESIEAFSGAEAFDAAREVAKALKAFHAAGAAAGNIAFWRQHVSHFESPKAFALVVSALWQKPDLVAAMALLLQWLSQAETMPLAQGEYSFHVLAQRWIREVTTAHDMAFDARRALVCRFFELLEANAEDFWQVPRLELLSDVELSAQDDDEDDEEASHLFDAAYEDVVYIDSTEDGVDADMLRAGGGGATDLEWEHEARRVGERLTFLRTVAAMWKLAVAALGAESTAPLESETLQRWVEQAEERQLELLELLRIVTAHRVLSPGSSRDSLMDFERSRALTEAVAEKVVGTAIDMADAARVLRQALDDRDDADDPACVLDRVLRFAARGDVPAVRELWPALLANLRTRALLYVPPTKGGDPIKMFHARVLQLSLRSLLERLPQLGLLRESCQLIETTRLMESSNPVGPGAISEFDRLFGAGYESLVEALVLASQEWPVDDDATDGRDDALIECLEPLTESLLKQWLAHSRTLRLSVLERLGDNKAWQALVEFIERYGRDVFTQRFLNLANLRAILHQGVEPWLAKLAEEPSADEEWLLLEDLDTKLPRSEAVKNLSLVIETVVENYGEYRDYNSTTTQSDRGDLLYTLFDFLRVRVGYDRVAWHLKPLWIAHAVLVRHGRSAAAETWRRALAERTGELADKFERRCAELRKKYAMRLPTINDRLAERFVRPLTIDRVRALIRPAMEEARRDEAPDAGTVSFAILKHEIDELTQEPSGPGFDVPGWLEQFEQEVDSERRRAWRADDPSQRSEQSTSKCSEQSTSQHSEPSTLARDDVQSQLTDWELEPNG